MKNFYFPWQGKKETQVFVASAQQVYIFLADENSPDQIEMKRSQAT